MKLKGYIWWCGDEYCDCYQPRIVEMVPNKRFPGLLVERTVWEGTFKSGPNGIEYDELRRELADECARRGIDPATDTREGEGR